MTAMDPSTAEVPSEKKFDGFGENVDPEGRESSTDENPIGSGGEGGILWKSKMLGFCESAACGT